MAGKRTIKHRRTSAAAAAVQQQHSSSECRTLALVGSSVYAAEPGRARPVSFHPSPAENAIILMNECIFVERRPNGGVETHRGGLYV